MTSQKPHIPQDDERVSLAGFLLQKRLRKGYSIEIPSLGIVIEPTAEDLAEAEAEEDPSEESCR